MGRAIVPGEGRVEWDWDTMLVHCVRSSMRLPGKEGKRW